MPIGLLFYPVGHPHPASSGGVLHQSGREVRRPASIPSLQQVVKWFRVFPAIGVEVAPIR